MPGKLSALGNSPDQHQDATCDALNTEHKRRLAARDALNKPQLSSRTDAGREAERTQVNGKLYTVAKAEFDKSCPAVANGPAGWSPETKPNKGPGYSARIRGLFWVALLN